MVVGVSDGKQMIYLTRETLIDFLSVHSDLGLVLHNATFDLAVMQKAVGDQFDVYSLVDRNFVRDTMLLHRLYELATTGQSNMQGSSLADCAQKYLGINLIKDNTDASGQTLRTGFGVYLDCPQNIPGAYLDYLRMDVETTFQLYQVLNHRLTQLWHDILQARPFGFVAQASLHEAWNKYGLLTHHIQLKAAIALDAVTRNEMQTDVRRLVPLRESLASELRELETELLRYGYRPGKGSGKALQKILANIERKNRGVQFPRTESGLIAASKDDLEPYVSFDSFIACYLEASKIQKLLANHLTKIARGKLHPRYDVLKTTGRASSFGDLSSQNLPRLEGIRECFIASPGCVFIDADYSAVELVTLSQAMLTQFRQRSFMAEAINQGVDLHSLVAAKMTGKDVEHIGKEERQKAKAINFGKPGGMGDRTLAEYAGANYGVEMTESEAKQFSEAWMQLFPEMRFFLNDRNDLGEQIANLLGLNTLEYAYHSGRTYFDGLKPEMLGWVCRKVLAEENPATGNGRFYTDEEQDYFWSKAESIADRLPEKHRAAIMEHQASQTLAIAVSRLAGQSPVLTLTGRLRAGASYTARHNTIFQSLAADGAKLALWKLFRGGYRVVNFIHDEFLVEVPEHENLQFHAETIKRLMIEGMQEVVPDVRIGVEYAASRCWSKKAEPVYDESGRLVPWEVSAVARAA